MLVSYSAASSACPVRPCARQRPGTLLPRVRTDRLAALARQPTAEGARQSEKAEAATGSGCWDVTLCLPRPRAALPQAQGIDLPPHTSAAIAVRERQSARGSLAAGFRFPRGRPAPRQPHQSAQLLLSLRCEIYRCSCCQRLLISGSGESRRPLPGSWNRCIALHCTGGEGEPPVHGNTPICSLSRLAWPGLACLVTHARLGRDRKRMRVCGAPLAARINN